MPSLRRSLLFLAAVGAALLLAALPVTPALAEIIGQAFKITATTDAGDVATFTVQAPPNVDAWTWITTETIEMRSETGTLVATINPDGDETRVEYVDDPVITLAFAVMAGPVPTNFVIASGVLAFAPLVAEGRATVGMSLTDSDGDGATFAGIGDPAGAQGAYLAQYNGDAVTLSGTTFAELIQTMAAGVYETDVENAQVPAGPGFQAIGVPVGDMSVMVSFRLSAFDQASGTSTYVIQQRAVATEPVTWSRIKSLY